jgi:hypothetical protein
MSGAPTPRRGAGATAPGAGPARSGGSSSGGENPGPLGSSVGGANVGGPNVDPAATRLPEVPADAGGRAPAAPNTGGGVPALPSPSVPLPDPGSVTGRVAPDASSGRSLVPKSFRTDEVDTPTPTDLVRKLTEADILG